MDHHPRIQRHTHRQPAIVQLFPNAGKPHQGYVSLMTFMSFFLPRPSIRGFLQPTSFNQKASSSNTSITRGR